ncbi:putative F-box/LRR-repeat protein 23 [Lotus japonicus]|uniref:putative F-box/LRR-repeat protein 23 n=1 Tax=Lotus japonicus TaxID=34305 RepID=UPI002590BF0D|nr:putative F-box/LRR-repeat protein 23 [Lotus japonicus]
MGRSRGRKNKSKKKKKKEKKPNWLELPLDVTAKILHNLGTVEVVKTACHVCSLWRNICKDPLMWRTIDIPASPATSRSCSVNVCRFAVDQSCGLLQEINIELFGTDVLLKYIADRATHLRRLRLYKCWAVSERELIQVVKKLSLLEEIDLSFCYLSRHALEVICRCCPHLKVLKFNKKRAYECFKNNNVAFAIAKTLHELRHLQLLGNCLTNDGLLAILDGCPHLESLDLRACSNVDLSGALGERCHKQIKKLLLPYEDLDDIYCNDIDEDGGNYYYDDERDLWVSF